MAAVTNKLVIEADPNQPVAEINNIITAFLQLWPGSETMILQGIRAEIDNGIARIESAQAKQEPVARQSRPQNRQERRQQRQR
jgi:hypothetical protein